MAPDPARQGSDDAHLSADRGIVARLFAGLATALAFLLPLGRRAEPRSGEAVPDFARWFVLTGFVIGLAWAGGFRLVWRLYGETGGLRIAPSLAIVLLESLFTGALLALGLARSAVLLTGGRSASPAGLDSSAPLPAVGTLVLFLVILSQFAMILAVRATPGWWPPPEDWRSTFNFMYPQPIYRPLLLAPIWGRWGILVAATIGRTAPHADAVTAALSKSMRPGRLLLHALVPMLLTAIYCSRSKNYMTGVLIGLLVFGVTYVAAVAFARRGDGQTRQSMYAAGQVAQVSFLIIYLGSWRLIDG
jgi:hypothetical protein